MEMNAVKPLYNSISDFLKARFGEKVFKVTINTGMECPNRDGKKGYGGCVYCESSTLVPRDYAGEVDVRAQLATGMERVRKRHRAGKFIAYFQINTNTYAPPEYLEKVYREALVPDVVAIAVSTRPDCLDDRVLDVLARIKKERHLWLELGLQSADDATLALINRGHTAAEFEDAVKRAASRGIDVCAHMIIGLPGEGREGALKTISFLSRLPIWGVKFHQLQVIKGTRLEEMFTRGEVKALSLEEYSSIVIECLENLPPNVVVHRLCGDAPRQYVAAPAWGINKFIVVDTIIEKLRRMNTFQGVKFKGEKNRV